MKRPVQLLVGIWCCLMLIVTGMLFCEYRYVREQSCKLAMLKEEYEEQLMVVNRILQEYKTRPDTVDIADATTYSEKKNDIAEGFPEGARIVSSDDVTSEGDGSFVVINRDLEYLKRSTVDYIRKQRCSSLLQQIKQDEWQEYNQQVEQKRTRQRTAAKRRRVSRSRRVASGRKQRVPRIDKRRERAPGDFYLSWPIERSNFWLSSFFGPRKKANGAPGFHFGLDMAACKGTPVYAAAPGVVVEVRKESESRGYGNTIVVAHNHKYRTRYAHLKSIKVHNGDHVDRGTVIGTVGDTGLIRKRGKDGSHLHLELYAYGKKVDPLAFLV